MKDGGADRADVLEGSVNRDADVVQMLVATMTDFGMFVMDVHGIVTSWNAGAMRNTGYSSGEIIGRSFACLYTPEDVLAQRPQRSIAAALAHGSFEEECNRLDKHGHRFWALVTITALRDSVGVHLGYSTIVRNLTAQRIAESSLRLRDRALGAVAQGVCITDVHSWDNGVVYVNDGFLRMTGYERDDFLGRNCRFLQGPETSASELTIMRDAVNAGAACQVQLLNYRKDGSTFWNAVAITPLCSPDGTVTHFLGVHTDVSAVKLLELQLQQAQKLEAVGQLAGGIAHDFNNLLTIILGCAELLILELSDTGHEHELLNSVVDAAERASALTRQLLAFSRQSALESKLWDVNDIVTDAERLLRRILGEDVHLDVRFGRDLPMVRVDAGQFGQILLNLAVNARDAMPTGGNLTIATERIVLDVGLAVHNGVCVPGTYVRTTITDDGAGMPTEVLRHLFEPFFTTKGVGRGTGLGLATVYGIVHQSGGHIVVESVVGRGSVFTIYLPADDASAAVAIVADATTPSRGVETILLVEDDVAVRDVAKRSLLMQGYAVVDADSGASALNLLEKGLEFDMLITDVVMPGVSGMVLAATALRAMPDLPVLFMTGYTDDAVARHGIRHEDVAFLQKPFTPQDLGRAVRAVLDAR